MAKGPQFWVAHFNINGDSHHLMAIQSDVGKAEVEKSWQRFFNAHKAEHPHLEIRLDKLERLESPEQMDKAVAELHSKYPRQIFADEYCPENPNALLFRPMDASGADVTGRADEALLRYLCDGFVT